MRFTFLLSGTMALLVIATVEILSFFSAEYLKAQNIIYEPPETYGYEGYLRSRDPVLGWPSKMMLAEAEFDPSGGRFSPAFPDPAIPPCVEVYGDSFTWGAEVEAEYSYPNVLAELLGCRVANYGIGGYGSDQAFLRYREVNSVAPIVVLGHFSENIVRNVNQLRDLLSGNRFGFKPRYLEKDGRLIEVPLPSLNAQEYLSLSSRGEQLLPHEYFLPGRGGQTIMTFPYSFTMLRALSHYRIRARLLSKPAHSEFYDLSHPSNAVGVTARILAEFTEVAQSQGQLPIVVVIPDSKDLEQLRSHGSVSYEPLLSMLRDVYSVDSPNIAEQMLYYLEDRDACTIYISCSRHSHYNPEGYALLAALIHQWIANTSPNVSTSRDR